MNDGNRISETGRFHDQPLNPIGSPTLPLAPDFAHRDAKIVTYLAAQAAIGEKDDILRNLPDKVMIDSDLAKLIDDYRRAGELR
jgi:hypothetical protein